MSRGKKNRYRKEEADHLHVRRHRPVTQSQAQRDNTMPTPKLTARQARFVDEYLVDLNATRAAIAAGYSKRTAAQAGHEVLTNPKVAAEIARRQQERSKRLDINADRVIGELAKIAFGNVGDFYREGEDGRLEVDMRALLDPEKAAALSQIEISDTKEGGQIVKFRLAEKRGALNDIAQLLQLFDQTKTFDAPPVSEDEDLQHLAMGVMALLGEAMYSRPAQVEQTAPRIAGPPVQDLATQYADESAGTPFDFDEAND